MPATGANPPYGFDFTKTCYTLPNNLLETQHGVSDTQQSNPPFSRGERFMRLTGGP